MYAAGECMLKSRGTQQLNSTVRLPAHRTGHQLAAWAARAGRQPARAPAAPEFQCTRARRHGWSYCAWLLCLRECILHGSAAMCPAGGEGACMPQRAAAAGHSATGALVHWHCLHHCALQYRLSLSPRFSRGALGQHRVGACACGSHRRQSGAEHDKLIKHWRASQSRTTQRPHDNAFRVSGHRMCSQPRAQR